VKIGFIFFGCGQRPRQGPRRSVVIFFTSMLKNSAKKTQCCRFVILRKMDMLRWCNEKSISFLRESLLSLRLCVEKYWKIIGIEICIFFKTRDEWH
jgi:hypothetical protein